MNEYLNQRHSERASFSHRGEELQADARRQKEIADSKYLGGDIHHTHLVKGLDYALLERTREDVGAAADPQALDDALDDAAAALADAQAAAVKERQEEVSLGLGEMREHEKGRSGDKIGGGGEERMK